MRFYQGAAPCRPRRALEASVGQHIIDGDALPYAPDNLARKPTCGVDGFLGVDLRVGTISDAAPFAGARKPDYRLRVDFGPVVGVLETSAQITHYRIEKIGRAHV